MGGLLNPMKQGLIFHFLQSVLNFVENSLNLQGLELREITTRIPLLIFFLYTILLQIEWRIQFYCLFLLALNYWFDYNTPANFLPIHHTTPNQVENSILSSVFTCTQLLIWLQLAVRTPQGSEVRTLGRISLKREPGKWSLPTKKIGLWVRVAHGINC